ncbi:MAG: hypothetical protein K2L03_00975 [Bacteroidales bacterium]|nr:hypothetical protein [Bacteroidales bacterium]MDE6514593.1 hypothetical protein [Bacteroidales bacterium]MDE7103821.1 hypothetical protein [Bacteroidales bacterium]
MQTQSVIGRFYRLGGIMLGLAFLLGGCGIYSFTGASIPPEAKTINIGYFKNKAPTVQPTLSTVFSDKLQEYFVSQSNLTQVYSGVADITLTGEISQYNIAPIALQSNDQAAKNRLTIGVRVRYVSRFDPKSNFEQTFTRYEDWDAKINLNEVEDGLIETISTQLVEDIYQRAFVNW